MLGLTYLSEYLGELSLVAMLSQFWALPFLIYLNVANSAQTDKWVTFAIFTLLLAYPIGTLTSITISSYPPVVDKCSPPNPGGMELAKLQRCPVPHRLGSMLQHVCAGGVYCFCEYL
jgi:hypothetical protein